MIVTQNDEKGSLVEILDSLSFLEDNEPRKNTKEHIKWEKKILDKREEYNLKVDSKVFNTTVI